MTDAVSAFYNSDALREWQRLDTPFSKIEFASALRLIQKYLPSNGRVCDIGGGPGRYAIELTRQGFRVSLCDLSSELVQFAQHKSVELSLPLDQTMVCDARNLDCFDSDSFDAGLLMGPMYHLIATHDRQQVLAELHRILKPQAKAIVTYLNSWGLIRTGVVDFPQFYEDVVWLRGMLTGDSLLRRGEQAVWFWSTPGAAMQELRDSGFNVMTYASAQGFAGGMQPLIEKLAVDQPKAYQNVVQIAAESSELPQYRDCSEHIHFVVQRL